MHRNPVVGDVIRIGKSKIDWLVVYSQREREDDTLRNDYYQCDVFHVINLEMATSRVANPKVRKYQLPGGSMTQYSELKLEHLELVKQVKVKEYHEISYEVK